MSKINIPWRLAASPGTFASRLNRWQGYNLILVLVASLVLLLISLHFALESLWQRAARAIQGETERQADTIARLLVFEFSHLQDLRLTGAATLDPAVEAAISRRLWEKVTFNEIIRGIELISAQVDPEGRYLTFSFYNLPSEASADAAGPQKAWQSFSGPERTLITLVHRERRVDRSLLEAINRGPKIEGELLLRYLPLYLPQPDRGALYWGVVKVAISSEALRRFYVLLDEERLFLQRLLAIMALLGTVTAIFLGLAGSNWINRQLTLPIRQQAELEAKLSAATGVDLESLRYQVQQLPTLEVVEFEQLKTGYLRLLDLNRILANGLATWVPDGGLGRWQRRLAAALPPDHPVWPLWQELTAVSGSNWAEVDPAPWLSKCRTLMAAVLPPELRLEITDSPLPLIAGNLKDLLQVIILLSDFVLQEVSVPGSLSWRAETTPAGALSLNLAFSGRSYQEEECRRWLTLTQRDSSAHWSLALAAALAKRLSGILEVNPIPTGGLSLLLRLPSARIKIDESQGTDNQ